MDGPQCHREDLESERIPFLRPHRPQQRLEEETRRRGGIRLNSAHSTGTILTVLTVYPAFLFHRKLR